MLASPSSPSPNHPSSVRARVQETVAFAAQIRVRLGGATYALRTAEIDLEFVQGSLVKVGV